MKSYLKKGIVRLGVILFWTAIFFGLLYIPEIKFFGSKRSINVFAWGDILEPSVVAEFEETTGIKVNLNFYASNEELIVKLKATGGEGYDMIIPSDYSVEILGKEDLLQPLDHNKLNFMHRVNPKLLNLPFDPGNIYSVPFEWEIFLLGFDKEYFASRSFIPSWKSVFDIPLIDYRITMSNDPMQSLQMASFYRFGYRASLTDQELKDVIQVLKEQKKVVNAYADFRADYFLATKNSQVVVCSSSYLWRTIRKFPFVGYAVPQEGTFITVESFCIPKASKKQDLTYQLIHFLFSKASMRKHYEVYGIFPSTVDSLDDLDLDQDRRKLLLMSDPLFENIHFFSLISSQEKIRDAWVQIKSL